jgi:hypothetical protein
LEKFADDHRFDEVKPHANVQIFLLSDGYPKMPDGRIAKDDLIKAIKGDGSTGGLMGIIKQAGTSDFYRKITINTAYYWGNYLGSTTTIPQDPENKILMEALAEAGDGKFIEFKNGKMVDLAQYQSGSGKLRKDLIAFYVTPLGLKWDDTEKALMSDSDHDGLTDAFEKSKGSNANKADTDDDGISDGVNYRIRKQVCRQSNCAQAPQLDPICKNYLSESGEVADSDGDGLNNCEEKYLESDMDAIDSNNNFLPDDMEFYLGNNITSPNLLTADSDGDGISDFDEIRLFLPPHIHNNQISGYKSLLDYELMPTTIKNGSQCFSLVTKNIPALQRQNFNSDKVVVTLVYQNKLLTKETYYYRAVSTVTELNSLKQTDFKQVLGFQ